MPKSKRSKVFNLTQVTKKGREQKDKLFQNIRDAVPEYQFCFVFSVDNMRNNYLKDVRRELSDSRYASSPSCYPFQWFVVCPTNAPASSFNYRVKRWKKTKLD